MTEEKIENPTSIIMEIRAGTGGEEAALFAGDLFKMYSNYIRSKDWGQKILDSHPTSLGGIKQITFQVKGDNAWPTLKNEAGVHRVQRTPQTEKSGRIHTSTATVAVLPTPKKEEIEIRPSEIKIDHYRASGPGGQYVNKRESAIRITHLPSGIVVTSQTERNQLENKENAINILSARLMEKKTKEQQEKIVGERKDQIGSAERSEKIRTYNFPQNRVTDHRINKSWHNLDKIIEGKMDKIIKKLTKEAKK
jgi:peptide chain release factor 1